jgi:hypothetical protein
MTHRAAKQPLFEPSPMEDIEDASSDDDLSIWLLNAVNEMVDEREMVEHDDLSIWLLNAVNEMVDER